MKEFPIIAIDKSKIVDSNGAGDAFVGGTLYYMTIHCVIH